MSSKQNEAGRMVHSMLKSRGIRLKELSRRLGQDERLLSQKFTRQKDVKVTDLIMCAEAAGYEITFAMNDNFRLAPEVFYKEVYERQQNGKIGREELKIWAYDPELSYPYTGCKTEDGVAEVFETKEELLEWLKP